MSEFWETAFQDKNEMWGLQPADAAVSTMELFLKQGLKEILIPGFGYGRNAKIFLDHGINVTGIEISKTAINLAKNHIGNKLKVYHGNVCNMPFDQQVYDGIFCHALIHLLNEYERLKLITDCYGQLRLGGYMVFTAISKNTPAFGEGIKMGNNWYKSKHGVNLFYYDSDSIENEFGRVGLTEFSEKEELEKGMKNKPGIVFWTIICHKIK